MLSLSRSILLLRSAISTAPRRCISFSELGVNLKLAARLKSLNISQATDIQEKSIPLGLRNCSPIVISSETGSGKTLAYLLPFLSRLQLDPYLRMLVMLPRKELAYQVDSVVHQLCPTVATAVAVGKWEGINAKEFPSVVIGTPKPVYEFVRKAFGKKNVEMLQLYRRTFSTLVLDEADIILNDPFCRFTLDTLHVLERINEDLSVVAAGATIPRNGKKTAGGILSSEFHQLFWCEGEERNSIPSNISVSFIEKLDDADKKSELNSLASKLQNRNSILFVKNVSRAEEVASALKAMNVKVQIISQDLDDAKRDQAIRKVMKDSNLCTICTDLVSRGLDTQQVSLVIQYDFATDISAFLHRCGRTGRNGKQGEVICFVTPENDLLYNGIKKCGVHNDLSSLYSRKRLLRKKYKKQG